MSSRRLTPGAGSPSKTAVSDRATASTSCSGDAEGRLAGAERADDDEATRDWLLSELRVAPRTIPSLAEALMDTQDEVPTPEHAKRVEDRLGHALRRMEREGWVEKPGSKSGRALLWAVKWRP